MQHKNEGYQIDCVDILIAESKSIKEIIGFSAMSKFRMYKNRQKSVGRMLLPILMALEEKRQNMAFVNVQKGTMYVHLSGFY